jgi:hypothetical protein
LHRAREGLWKTGWREIGGFFVACGSSRMTILSNLSDWRNNGFFGLESNRLFNAQGFGGVADVSGGTCQMSAR